MFVPVLIMLGILFIATSLLAIADSLLSSFGNCRISVSLNGHKEHFVVQGGGTLLEALRDRGFDVPNSCAGQGTCGRCKVIVAQGGGTLMPTEEALLTRQEAKAGARLACQVKIRRDMEIRVPLSQRLPELVPYRVEKDACRKCGVCATECPAGAIRWEQGKAARIVSDACLGCGVCAAACPFGAIAPADQPAPRAPLPEKRAGHLPSRARTAV